MNWCATAKCICTAIEMRCFLGGKEVVLSCTFSSLASVIVNYVTQFLQTRVRGPYHQVWLWSVCLVYFSGITITPPRKQCQITERIILLEITPVNKIRVWLRRPIKDMHLTFLPHIHKWRRDFATLFSISCRFNSCHGVQIADHFRL